MCEGSGAPYFWRFMHQNNGHPANLVFRYLSHEFKTDGQLSEECGLSVREVRIGLSRLILTRKCDRKFETIPGTEVETCVYRLPPPVITVKL